MSKIPGFWIGIGLLLLIFALSMSAEPAYSYDIFKDYKCGEFIRDFGGDTAINPRNISTLYKYEAGHHNDRYHYRIGIRMRDGISITYGIYYDETRRDKAFYNLMLRLNQCAVEVSK